VNIIEQIDQDLIQAQKSKNEAVISTLRMIKNSAKNASIEKKSAKGGSASGGDDLNQEEVIKILRSEVKKRNESVEAFKKGERQDLADKETAEIETIKKYLPKEISDEDINKVVVEVIESTKAQSPKDFGQVMGVVMKKLVGAADGGKVTQLVKQALEKQEEK